MVYFVLKVALTAALVLAVSEIAKRSTLLGGLVASLPVVSVLALTWLYVETRDVERVARLATSILWLVVPSLALLVVLPWLLRRGVGFAASLGGSLAAAAAAYVAALDVARRLGVDL